jgi:AraC-like DNA-binding protein
LTRDLQPFVSGERIAWRRPPALGGVEVLLARATDRPWRVFHEAFSIWLALSAAGAFRCRHREHEVAPGSMALFEPGETHVSSRDLAPGDLAALFVPPRDVLEAASEFGSCFPSLRAYVTRDKVLFRRASRLLGRLGRPSASKLELQCLYAEVVLRLVDAHLDASPRRLFADDALGEMVRDRLFDAPAACMEELERDMAISRWSIALACRQRFGMAFGELADLVRISRARRELSAGRAVADVAQTLGWTEETLRAQFTVHVGASVEVYAAAR